MKKTKRFLGFLLTAAMLMSCISVSAAYPTELSTVPEVNSEADNKLANRNNDNSKWAFTHDLYNTPRYSNFSFVLLDKNSDGEYLIATNGIFPGNTKYVVDEPEKGWQYDPTAEGTLAWWINTYLDSNGKGKALHWIGKEMRENMVEKQWKIEAAPNQDVSERTIIAKAVLPSYTEYVTYREKLNAIKMIYPDTKSEGVLSLWLRTPSNYEEDKPIASEDGTATTPQYKMLQISSYDDGYLKSHAVNVEEDSRMQLMFWVNKDFFKNVKVGNIGSEVAKQLKSDLTLKELMALYTNDELKTYFGINLDSENAPKITNIQVKTNIAAPGGTATLSYTSTPASEENSVTWYIADDAEGTNPVKIDGASGAELTIPSSAGGKYLMAGITPILGNEIGSIVYSQPIPIEAALSTYSTAEEVSGTAWGMERDNNRDYMFSVNKTNFTLLEAAEDGSDFLVLVDPAYVSPASRIISKTETKAIASMDPSKNSYLPSFLNTTYLNIESDDKTAAYQYGDESCNIKGLPAGVAQYVNRDALWRTEKSAAGDEYVFKAAVTLPSVSEIYKHRDKIGYNNNAVFTIWGTRTAVWASTASDTPNMVTFTPYNDTWRTNVSGNMQTNIYLRPILRLKREFFMNKNVLHKLGTTETVLSDRLAEMGSEVKKMLVANFARSELKGVYSDEELTAIGFSDNEPVISNVTAQGIASVAQTLTAGFEYSDPKGSALKSAEYQWYSADGANGTLSKIDGATDKTYKVTPDMLGKYIAVSVKVCNSDDAKSATVFSPLTGPIAEREEVIVTPVSISNKGAVFSVDNAKTDAANMVILYCVYDKTTNRLVHITPVTISAPNGESSQSVELTGYTAPDDCKVKAMVWDGLNTIVPYAMIEK